MGSVPGLDALEIDPEQAAADYRERIIGPVRAFLPAREIAEMTEQLSGSCTTEIASFNEFTGLLADPTLVADYDHVLFDTAPTGHTIRLLKLPGDWTGFLDTGKGDASCLGPLSGLEKQRTLYGEAVAALADPSITRLVLVARAQASSPNRPDRRGTEETGINPAPVINGVLPVVAIRKRNRQPSPTCFSLAGVLCHRTQARQHGRCRAPFRSRARRRFRWTDSAGGYALVERDGRRTPPHTGSSCAWARAVGLPRSPQRSPPACRVSTRSTSLPPIRRAPGARWGCDAPPPRHVAGQSGSGSPGVPRSVMAKAQRPG